MALRLAFFGVGLFASAISACGGTAETYEDFAAAGRSDGVSIVHCTLLDQDNCNLYIGRSKNRVFLSDRDALIAQSAYDAAFDDAIPALWQCAERYGLAERNSGASGGWRSLWLVGFHERSDYEAYERCKSELTS